jgi:CBS domain-containing protein
MKVKDVMTQNPECCTPDDSLTDAARIMKRRDVGFVPVVDSRDTRRLVGCVTDRDIVTRAIAEGKDPDAVSLGAIMTDDLVCCSPDDDVEGAKRLMAEHRLRRVLACDEDGSLIGVVALADIARRLHEQAVGETEKAISQPA